MFLENVPRWGKLINEEQIAILPGLSVEGELQDYR